MCAVATTGTFEALAKSLRYSMSCVPSIQRSVALLPTTRMGWAALFIIATATSGFVIGFAFFVAAISAHCQGSQDIHYHSFIFLIILGSMVGSGITVYFQPFASRIFAMSSFMFMGTSAIVRTNRCRSFGMVP